MTNMYVMPFDGYSSVPNYVRRMRYISFPNLSNNWPKCYAFEICVSKPFQQCISHDCDNKDRVREDPCLASGKLIK